MRVVSSEKRVRHQALERRGARAFVPSRVVGLSRALVLGAALWLSAAAQATALWDIGQPDQLALGTVAVDGQRFTDVVLRFADLRSYSLTGSGQRLNRFVSATGELTLAEVVVQGTTFYDVVVVPSQVLGVGGVSATTTRRVKVVGDSLADSGAFGYKFTVQGTASAPARIWTDQVAAALAAPALCPRYLALSEEEAVLNPAPSAADCTSFAVGGGRTHPLGVLGRSFDSSPFSVAQQLRDLAAADAYDPNDLLLVVAGGNDAADLLGAFMRADSDQGLAFILLINEMLSTSQVLKAMSDGREGRRLAGHQHMVALANRLADRLVADALGRGAQRVVAMTLPDVSRTPRFAALLAGRNDAAELTELTRAWVSSFNAQLQTRLAAHADRVAVVDFFSALNSWLDQPAAHGLSNVTTPACPVTGTDSNGLPTYQLATCTEASLADGWQGHLFSDHFHGTPRTNLLMARLVLQTLQARGWR